MALTQKARTQIKSFVQKAKSLLMKEFAAQLQQHYGIRPDGSSVLVEELTSKDGSIIQTARLLRERLAYLEETIAGKNKKQETVEQLVREQAFTILNRFAALRMAEERNIIREAVRKGYSSEGFQVFDQLTGGAQSAEQFVRYTWYIKAVFDELAIDLPAVFDRFSPYALLFPSEKVLLELLDIIDDEDLHIFREEGQQPINLWKEDETIGWIYQYYNSREEISAMREASGAPRNSRELAVRNQFFTPRYVVQFLVDNSLGRQWYEMNQGNTALVNDCQYLVKREQEIFLAKGEDLPEAKIEGAHYVEHRSLKDPREILMLDPACGSMHFGLYCFDLFEKIYTEAWDNHPELMPDLRDQYLREDFIKQIPEMIIRYNIHGVDIDPRAIQIAGLSLWLRAQKSYDALGLQAQDRPAISKSNLVVAEPMPGDVNMLSEFTKGLPGPIGKLVRVIWDKMKLAGETGLLLKIEEELKKEIEIAREEYKEFKKTSAQTAMFDTPEKSKTAEMAAIYGKGQKISKDFFDTAEEEVLKALKSFSENAEGQHAFQKLLFAEDTARGFAFIELCRKRYDVITQNPPFGSTTINTKSKLVKEYPLTKDNLAAIFVDRCIELLIENGSVGSITTRSPFYLGSFKKWRSNVLIPNRMIQYFADFGSEVLDATVETSAYVISRQPIQRSVFIDLTMTDMKASELLMAINEPENIRNYSVELSTLLNFPNTPLCYWVDKSTVQLFEDAEKFESTTRTVRKGICTSDNFRYTRNYWEIDPLSIGINVNDFLSNKRWGGFINTESSIRFVYEPSQLMNWQLDGVEVKAMQSQMHGNYSKRINSESSYFKTGLSWAFRTSTFQPHIVPPGSMCTSGRFLGDLEEDEENIEFTCGIWNSVYFDYMIKLCLEASSGNPKFINGVINKIPHPYFPEEFKNNIIAIQRECYNLMLKTISFRENSYLFMNNDAFTGTITIDEYCNTLLNDLSNSKAKYLKQLERLNQEVFNFFHIASNEQDIIRLSASRLTTGEEGDEFNLTNVVIKENIFAVLVAVCFGRIDQRLLKFSRKEMFDHSPFLNRYGNPFLIKLNKNLKSVVLKKEWNEIDRILDKQMLVQPLDEIIEPRTIVNELQKVIKFFWPESHNTIEEELLEHFKAHDLSEIFVKHSKFFDAHLKDYSRNKRISPIYWHMGVPSGKFNVWVYYPKLNSNSLYKIVNELVEPKLEEVQKDIASIEMGGSAKELNEQQTLRDELLDFKGELLRVAQLPYKPMQDDGVLITAAPLHNLFRHTRWRKSTEDCWKKLEKGDYDWAHLAYSIWPDRVANKCKKELSMAIAHGLEDICEIKPKETKPRTKKGVAVKTQNKLL